MKKLLLVALCSTSLLSIARAEGGGDMGNSMQQGDAMKAGDDAGHAGSMAPGATQGAHETAKEAKKQAKKQGADARMKHDGMDHGSMQHDGQMDSGTK